MSCHLISTFIVTAVFMLQCAPISATEESFLLINGITEEVVLKVGPHINEKISPCSSFKIVLSLMGYEENVLIDEATPSWDFQEGYDDFLETWKAFLTPQSWMKYSCLWYSKIIALDIGVEKIQNYLKLIDYGNEDISGGLGLPGPVGVAWINSSLKISPREQVEFLKKTFIHKSVFSVHAIRMTKQILFKDELSDGWKLYGKTGWSGSDITKDGISLEHGWFVGWIEKDQSIYPFAYLIRDKRLVLDQRIPRVKQLLEESRVTTIVN